MPKPEYHVFVCGQQRPAGHPRSSCSERGSGALINSFSQQLIARNLLNKVSLVPTACLGPCQTGANVLVFPGSILYMNIKVEDVEAIIQEHLVEGNPIAEKMAPAELW